MDKKLTLVIGIWLSGVAAGVLLVARWMNMDLHKAQTSTPTPTPGASPDQVEPTPGASPDQVEPTPKPEGQHGLHRFSDPIMAGAKADMVRVRRACNRVGHRVASSIGHEPNTNGASSVSQVSTTDPSSSPAQ